MPKAAKNEKKNNKSKVEQKAEKGKEKKAPKKIEASDSSDSSDSSEETVTKNVKKDNKKEQKKVEKKPAKKLESSSDDSDSDNGDSSSDGEAEVQSKKRKNIPADEGEDDEPPAKKAKRAEQLTLFVGNLLFSTTVEELQEFFSEYNTTSIRLVNDSNTGQAKGFGYVDVPSEQDLEALLLLNGTEFNGRNIKIDRTKGASSSEIETSKVVFVGNLSFETSEDDLSTLFGDCGGITEVRIVKDADGNSKGFGYVEFEDLDSADKAVKLHGTELDGRNLRINYEASKRDGGGRGGRGGRGGFGDRGGRGFGDRGGRGFGDRGGRGRGGDRGGRGFGDRGGRGGRGGFGDRGGRGRGGDRGGRGGRGGFGDRGGRGGFAKPQGRKTTFDD